jgi:hypothetical protein
VNPRRKGLLALGVVGLAIGAGIFYNKWKTDRERRFTSQCANHAIQHMFTFRILLDGEQTYQFSSETNARLALAPITENVKTPEGDWLDSFWSACPESFERDRSIGYLFLAESLEVDEKEENAAIILICPAENHQGSSEHCHAVMSSGLECLTNNLVALEMLRSHLARAESGVIKYSTNAQMVMRREIEAREKCERGRKR